MNKKLINIVAPIIISIGILLNRCGNPYEKALRPENWKPKQKQFVNNMHELYGEQVSYNELKNHIRGSLDKYEAKAVNHFLKDYVKKENCWDNIDDKTLVVVYEA